MHTSSSSRQGAFTSASYGNTSLGVGAPGDDLEPSDEWKARLKKKIGEELASMEAAAKKQFEEDIRSRPQDREYLQGEYQRALKNIQVIAEDQFRTQLEQERQERKWAAAIPMEGNVIPDSVRQEQEALYAKIKQESAGDASQNREQRQPGSAGIPNLMQSSSSSRSQPLPVFPDRLPPLPPNMPPLPTLSPSKEGEQVWIPKSSASASSSRPPTSPSPWKSRPSSNPDRPDRGQHPSGPYAKTSERNLFFDTAPSSPGDERDPLGVSKSPPSSSARLSPWSTGGVGSPGGFGGGGTSPRLIERPPTVSPLSEHPLHHSPHQPPPPQAMARSPPGTSASPQLWKPSTPDEDTASPKSATPSYTSEMGMGGGGPGSTTSTSSSTSKPFSTIGRRGSSASMRSIASTNSMRSIASATSMTSMLSSVSGKGRRVMDDAIPERVESGSEGGFEADDDAVDSRQSMEPEGEEAVKRIIAEGNRKIHVEQQRQRGVEQSWGSRNSAEADVEDIRPARSRTYPQIPVLPVGPSSSSESKKSGKRKAKPLSAAVTAPPLYDIGYMRSGKDVDVGRDWEREELSQSKTKRSTMRPSPSKQPSSSTRPISIQPTLIADEYEKSPYSQSHSPYPQQPLSSSASSSKRTKSISRKPSYTEPPAIYGPGDIPPARSGRRWSNEQNTPHMYGSNDLFDGRPSVLPTPPSSASNTRANSVRQAPNRGVPHFASNASYVQEPDEYDEDPAGFLEGYEQGEESDEQGWGPGNPERRYSSSSSSAMRWNNPSARKSARRGPGPKQAPQPLSLDHDEYDNGNASFRSERPYRGAHPHTAQPTHPQTWYPTQSARRPTGDGDPSPQKAPQPPYSADPYGRQEHGSASRRNQQVLWEREQRAVRPQRTTSMRSNGTPAPPPELFGSHSRRPSQRGRDAPRPGMPPESRRPRDSDEDQEEEGEEEGLDYLEEGLYRQRQEYDQGQFEETQPSYPPSRSSKSVERRKAAGHGVAGPSAIRGRHQHRYRQPSQRQQRVRIEEDGEIVPTESDEGSEEAEEEESEEDSEEEEEESEEGEAEAGPRRRWKEEGAAQYVPPVRPKSTRAPREGPQVPGSISRAPSGGPGYGRMQSEPWEPSPQSFYRDTELHPPKQKKKKEKRRWPDNETREMDERESAERLEAEERGRVEAERAKKEHEKREARQKEEWRAKRDAEEKEKAEKAEREKREDLERQWELERERERREKRELEEEALKAAMQRQMEDERAEMERQQQLQEDEFARKVNELKALSKAAEEKMRNAQDLAAKNQLADERAEEYERKNEEARRLAQEAAARYQEADKRYNEALKMQAKARARAAEMKKKELEILTREADLKRKEAQLRRLEDELKRKEQDRVLEEERRKVEEKMRRLLEEEEAMEEQRNLEQAQEADKERLQDLVAQQAKELEDLKREMNAEKARNADADSYGLASIFGEDEPRVDNTTAQAFEDEIEGGKNVKPKKEKKGKSKSKKQREVKDRQGSMEQERLVQEQRDREEHEEQREREEQERHAQEERDRAEQEQLEREQLQSQEQDRQWAQEGQRGKPKRRKDKRKSKEQRELRDPQPQADEDFLPPTAEELEDRDQRQLEAEERRKQDAQEAERQERERAQAERGQREAEERQRQDNLRREKEVEAMKRAREAMEAEERFRREQEAKRREEEERMERKRQEEEAKRREEDSRGAQQAGFRKLDEEIRRKRQDSGGGIESAWTSFNASTSSGPSSRSPPPARNFTTPFPGERPAPAWTSWGTTPSPTPGSAWSTNMAGSTPTAGFPPRASTTVPNKSRSGSTGAADPYEWQRKQEEFTRQQQEQYRQTQARSQTSSWARAPTKDEFVKLFEENERSWISLSSRSPLRWIDFPWPMARRPSHPEDITTIAIQNYILSPYYPDKSRSEKDRVKDYIKRWHPDRFETKLLNKVVEEEKETVKEGAGSVVRSLNDLLAQMNV